MEPMRESWTDERLDDGFDRVDADLRAVRTGLSTFRVDTNERFDRLEGRIDKRFDEVDKRFDKIDERFERSDERWERREERWEQRFAAWDKRFDRWQHLLLSFMGSLLIGVVTLLFTHL